MSQVTVDQIIRQPHHQESSLLGLGGLNSPFANMGPEQGVYGHNQASPALLTEQQQDKLLSDPFDDVGFMYLPEVEQQSPTAETR